MPVREKTPPGVASPYCLGRRVQLAPGDARRRRGRRAPRDRPRSPSAARGRSRCRRRRSRGRRRCARRRAPPRAGRARGRSRRRRRHRRSSRTGDQRRIAVDHAVPDRAGAIVAGVGRGDERPASAPRRAAMASGSSGAWCHRRSELIMAEVNRSFDARAPSVSAGTRAPGSDAAPIGAAAPRHGRSCARHAFAMGSPAQKLPNWLAGE